MRKRKIPFPQANSLERIYGIFMYIDGAGISKFDMIKREGLAEREGAYYLDALYFLGFVDKFNTKYFLSGYGVDLQGKCKENGRESFAKAILEKEFFGKVFVERKSFEDDKKFRDYVAHKVSNDYDLGLNTAKRRTSTVVAWLQWIEINLKES